MPHLDDQQITGIWCPLHSHDARRQCIYPLCAWRLLLTHSCFSMKKKRKRKKKIESNLPEPACYLFVLDTSYQLTIYSVLMQTKQQKVDHSWSKVQGYQVRLTTNTIVYSCKRIQMLVIKLHTTHLGVVILHFFFLCIFFVYLLIYIFIYVLINCFLAIL